MVPLIALLLGSAAPSGAPLGSGLSSVVNDAFSPVLAWAIRSSRDQALQDGAKPIPPHLRQLFAPFIEERLLDQVRWNLAGNRPGVDTLVDRWNPKHRAVTLDNVIVFLDETAVEDRALWIHELLHVGQFDPAGVDGFSRSYIGTWRHLEQHTHDRARRVEELVARRTRARDRA